jgi:hypothetical protein
MTMLSTLRTTLALTLAVAGLVVVTPSASSLGGPTSCAPNERTLVRSSGSPTYAAIGPAAGKYNAGPTTGALSVSITTTTSRSTGWTTGASASVGWGIAKVEASYSYTVTSTTSSGRTVTDSIAVPGHNYGYAQPKVEYRRFHIYDVQTNADCSTSVTHDYGYLNAITSYPFFSECVSTAPCTPRP